MDNEDALQFVRERLRHNHGSLLRRELHLGPAPRVRRRFAVRMGEQEHRHFEHVDDSFMVRCAAGSMWITQDGDPKDVILAAGDCYQAGRQGALHLFALQPCLLEIEFEDEVVEH